MRMFKLGKLTFATAMIISLLGPDICLATEQIVDLKEEQEILENVANAEQDVDVYVENSGEDNVSDILENSEANIDENDNVSIDEQVSNSEENTASNTIISTIKNSSINLMSSVANTESVKTVKPGNGTLQEAIKNAKPGDTLKLEQGYYTGEDIEINKSINIIGKGPDISVVYPEIIITDEDDVKNDVYLEGFSSSNQQPDDGHIYYDIRKPVNLSLNNIKVFHISRRISQTERTISLNVSKDASNSNIQCKNTTFYALYDGLNIESSNTNITLDNTTISNRLAIKIANGSNNVLTICNGSSISGRSHYFPEDEAISIVSQENLTLNVKDSNIEGNDSRGDDPTYLFSFDGENVSHNTHINITGNTVINDYYGGIGSSIFNFGNSNTPENSNSIYVESGVKITPNTVAAKYNTNDKYVLVGIFDKNGNLTIKAYDKNQKVAGIEDLEETKSKDYSWFKKISDNTEPFDIQEQVVENMDLYPVAKEKVDVCINDVCYKIVKGMTLSEAMEESPELKAALEELKSKGKFTRFVDQNGSQINDNTSIIENTDIIAKYTVTVTVTYGGKSDEYTLEDGELFGDLKEKLTKYETPENKEFVKYVEIAKESNVITSSTQINSDIEIRPVYNVNVKVGTKTFKLEEGKSLDTLSDDKKSELEEEVKVDKKEFAKKFTNTKGEDIDYTTPISENTELTPKYNVIVTVEKLDGTKKEFTLEENKSLRSLGQDVIDQIEDFIVEATNFEHFINDAGDQVDYDTPIKENTNFKPIYNEKITITIKGVSENKQYTINEGENLNVLDESVLNEIKELVKVNNKNLAYFEDSERNIVDFTTSLTKRTTLTPKYKITVTVKPKYGDAVELEMLENSSLNTLNEELKQFEETENKEFLGYVDTLNNVVSKDKTFNEHVTIIPKYRITVKVQKDDGTYKEIKVDEGTTLDSIEELDEFETKVKDKTFDKYVNENSKEVSKSEALKENTTIIPKYNIRVTIKKSDDSSIYYDIPADIVLHRLSEEDLANLYTFVEAENKVFAETFVDENGNIIDFYTVLDKNVTLTPKYNVIVTVVTDDGDETFELEEGKTLKDLINIKAKKNLKNLLILKLMSNLMKHLKFKQI